MLRRYEKLLRAHFLENKQMAFLSGPRQVGKTTICRSFSEEAHYFNWDNLDDQQRIVSGPAAIIEKMGLILEGTVIFDELHKFPHWKNFIKGFFDTYQKGQLDIIVTGSARLDVYRKGADSLMGRYFSYHVHPLSVSEIVQQEVPKTEISNPQQIQDEKFTKLLKFGGFPEPFLRGKPQFYNQWKNQRNQLLFREEIRDTTRIQEISQVQLLAEFLRQQSGQLLNYASLARKIRASQDSIRRWLSALESLYFCFTIRPWTQNVSRSLLKDPKVYLWDWSTTYTEGSLNENFIASHLHKAVYWWKDNGLGNFNLYYLRTRDKREVDFLIAKNDKPWFLVEVKTSENQTLSRNLSYFQKRLGPSHAFQVVINADYIEADCFAIEYPVKVPAKTFLSQLI